MRLIVGWTGHVETVSMRIIRMQSNIEAEPRTDAEGRAEYEDDILRSLRRVIRAVDLYSRRLIAEYGLSGAQLLCLRQLERVGALPTGELAAAMSLTPATVCGILDRLEARGLVVRERQADDKRRVVVRLSSRGRTAVERAPPSLQDSFVEKLRALPSAEQAALRSSLTKLVEMMAAAELDAAPILTSGEAVAGDQPRRRAASTRKD